MSGLRGMFLIVRRSLRQHAVSTIITAIGVALGCGLLMSVFALQQQTEDAFTAGNTGFDAVVGARGSQLQLVLNSVFHLEQSPGNISWKRYTDIANDRRIKEAIPYAVGDNYKGFRIIGTVPKLFTKHELGEGVTFEFASKHGRVFDEYLGEAVIGSFVSQQTGMNVGSTFNSYHGMTFDEKQKHDIEFTVVGVLKPTNTPADRAIWIPLEAYFRMPGHALQGSGTVYKPQPGVAIPEEHKEVSAVMIRFTNTRHAVGMNYEVNRGSSDLTMAWPISSIMSDLFRKVGWVQNVLQLVAYMVIVVAACSIVAGLYNSMNERRREFAILRALGARRAMVFGAIVFESATIAAIGCVLSYGVYATLLAVTAWVVRSETGVVIEMVRWHPIMVIAPVACIVLGAVVGMIPAAKAYGTDVATNLVPAT